MKYLGTMLKALFAGAFALGTGLATVLVDNASLGDLTDGQWITVCVGALGAFGAVWGVSNKPIQ